MPYVNQIKVLHVLFVLLSGLCLSMCASGCANALARDRHTFDFVADTPAGQIKVKGIVEGNTVTDYKVEIPPEASGFLGSILGPPGAAAGMLLAAVTSHYVGHKRGQNAEKKKNKLPVV